MGFDMSRRGFIAGTATTATVAAGGLAFPAVLRAQEVERVTTVNLATGISILFSEYMAAKRFDRKHGIEIVSLGTYPSLTNYYTEFVAGRFDFALGAWDTFATRYLSGVPIQFLGSYTTADMIQILSPAQGPSSIAELKGRSIAGLLQSGAFRMTKAALKDFHGIDLGTDVKVQNVDNPAAAITMLAADRADAAVTWEPNVSAGLAKVPGLRSIYSMGADYEKQTGRRMPYFGIAVQKALTARSPSLAARIDRAYTECVNAIMANPAEVAELVAPKLDLAPEVLLGAFRSKRLVMVADSMLEPQARAQLKSASEFLAKAGILPQPVDDGFLVAA
ncbi:MAG TPA: ABC transporter substrate-binding protein [Azospirillum sp.]|nr:ABC transporter substrate-binding protein [Azospirillum sp.]